ncbi:MAG TPA: DUF1992 domain-containing protein [Acidimicrobiia bacterium]|nr:DUF1992 domain-containing protein [Acidimicrobiia bacterium]
MPTEPDDDRSWQVDANPDLVERQIRDAMERGEFDHLPGAGKPLPDVDRQYDPAWWAKRWLESARREDVAHELRQIVRVEGPRLRAAADREAAAARAEEINAAIRQVNSGLSESERIPTIDLER